MSPKKGYWLLGILSRDYYLVLRVDIEARGPVTTSLIKKIILDKLI